MGFIGPMEIKTEDLFFLRSPKFGQKNRFNFGEDLFFLEITYKSGEKCAIFLACFELHKTRDA